MADSPILMATLLPLVAILIIIGWVVVLTSRRRQVSLRIRGLGIRLDLAVTELSARQDVHASKEN